MSEAIKADFDIRDNTVNAGESPALYDTFRLTCEQGCVTVGHTDTQNGSSVTTEENVTRHYTKE